MAAAASDFDLAARVITVTGGGSGIGKVYSQRLVIAGVVGFTRAPVREVGSDGIRVNCIAPGLTLSEAQIATSDPAHLEKRIEGRSIRRPQVPENLVGAVVFLLSDASGFITGQTLLVDGGKVFH